MIVAVLLSVIKLEKGRFKPFVCAKQGAGGWNQGTAIMASGIWGPHLAAASSISAAGSLKGIKYINVTNNNQHKYY